MATVKFKGVPVQTVGSLPEVGTQAPPFKLTGTDLVDVGLEQFAGKKKIINIVHSLDTSVCAASALKLGREVAALPDTVLINVSADLPFAQKRACATMGLKNVVMLSAMRSPSFGKDYGVQMVSGPLAGLMSRAVVVLDKQDKVVYTEQVVENAQEPNYEAALFVVKKV